MDQFLLQGAVTEAAVRLVEQEVLRVSCLGRHRYLIRFATARKDNLLLSVRPDLPRFHLVTARRVAEVPPDRFGAWLDQELTGATLLSLEKRPWDRVIDLKFRLPRREDGAQERRLVVELLGRSANVIGLDPEGLVLAHGRDMASRSRAPEPGKRYEPPTGREEFDAVPIGAEAVAIARERFGGALSFLSRVSPLFARDLTAAGADEEMAGQRLGEILEAARRASWSPVVYSSRALQEVAEGDDPGAADLIVAPLPLLAPRHGTASTGSGAPLVATSFPGCSEAAEAGFGLLERLRDFKDLRDHHEAIVRKEIEKLSSLLGKLETELAGARASDRFRRLGEALLAGLTKARVEKDRAIVPDPYASEGESLSVPIDPALPLHENARRLFERYKKGKRGATTIEKRLKSVLARLGEWRELAVPAAAVRTADDLERLREAMAGLGLVHAARPARGARPPRTGETPARVRRYTSPDGLLVLVGKSGEENDRLTFKVASPWDFWLHAAGRPGAHVVVRNPKRLKTLPEKSLRLAAEIAAYHSGARQEGKVEVHYTQRKHVHKRKGTPSGQVLLRRFRSVQVTPRVPTSTAEEV